jgi:hypothetical protein
MSDLVDAGGGTYSRILTEKIIYSWRTDLIQIQGHGKLQQFWHST